MIAAIAIACPQEVSLGAVAIAKGGQFEERQVEAAAVVGHQLGARIKRDAMPEFLGNVPWMKIRSAQVGNRLQPEVGVHANDTNRHGNLKTDRQEVGAVADARLDLGLLDCLGV